MTTVEDLAARPLGKRDGELDREELRALGSIVRLDRIEAQQAVLLSRLENLG